MLWVSQILGTLDSCTVIKSDTSFAQDCAKTEASSDEAEDEELDEESEAEKSDENCEDIVPPGQPEKDESDDEGSEEKGIDEKEDSHSKVRGEGEVTEEGLEHEGTRRR